MHEIKKKHRKIDAFRCREDQIRTGDPLHPIQVRYRAAPLPEQGANLMKIFLTKQVFSQSVGILSQSFIFD